MADQTERYSELSLYVSGRQSRGLIAMTQDEVDAIETGMATELFASSPCESNLPGNVAETAQPNKSIGLENGLARDTGLQVGRRDLRQRCYRKFLAQLPNLIEGSAGDAPTPPNDRQTMRICGLREPAFIRSTGPCSAPTPGCMLCVDTITGRWALRDTHATTTRGSAVARRDCGTG